MLRRTLTVMTEADIAPAGSRPPVAFAPFIAPEWMLKESLAQLL